MIRAVHLWVVLVMGVCLFEGAIYAQNSGGDDSTTIASLRPRRETYIIEPFPSPSMRGQPINIAYYNHNPEETSLRIVDVNDKTVIELQPRQFVENGIHSYVLNPRRLPNGSKLTSGAYFIRLTTYTSTGSKKQVQDSRFIVVH